MGVVVVVVVVSMIGEEEEATEVAVGEAATAIEEDP